MPEKLRGNLAQDYSITLHLCHMQAGAATSSADFADCSSRSLPLLLVFGSMPTEVCNMYQKTEWPVIL